MIYNAPSIYNQGGGGGGGAYNDGGALVDGDLIKVENNTISTYENTSRSELNFYYEVGESEVINSIIELTNNYNATVNVYILKNGIYYLLGNIGGNTVNSGNDYNIQVVGNSFIIENVIEPIEETFADINGVITPIVKIGSLWWTKIDYSAVVGVLNPGDKYYMQAATRTNGDVHLYNMEALKQIENILSGGWRIPIREDFYTLCQIVGGSGEHYYNGVGNQLKKIGAWNTDTGITNSSGFSSIPTGRYDDGNFGDSTNAFYWTSSAETPSINTVFSLVDGINDGNSTNGDMYYDYEAIRFCKDA